MHEPGHNPYITYNPNVFDWTSPSGNITLTQDLPTVSYSGIGDEILSALGNVFDLTGVESYAFPWLDWGGPEEGTLNPLGMQYSTDGGLYYDWGEMLAAEYAGQDQVAIGGYIYFPETDTWTTSQLEPIPIPTEYADYHFQDVPIGGGSALPFTDVFDPASIAATLSSIAGLDSSLNPGDSDYDTLGPIRAAEVKAITPEMIEKTTSAYYSPYEESERVDLIEKKGKALGGASTGGFAGRAGSQSGLSGAERLYQSGYGDLLGEIEKMKGQSTEAIMDTIYGWQELMSNV